MLDKLGAVVEKARDLTFVLTMGKTVDWNKSNDVLLSLFYNFRNVETTTKLLHFFSFLYHTLR